MSTGVRHETLSLVQLQRLGLDVDPFTHTPPGGRPYSDESIDTQVNVALHILQHTDQVLVVHGEPGLGKSSFIRLLQYGTGDELLLIRLPTGPEIDPEALYSAIAETGGIDGDNEVSATSALLRLWDLGQRPVLMLDDADAVPQPVLEALLGLHAELRSRQACPGLVLTASRDLLPLIQSHVAEGETSPHVINLHGLDESQTIQYIKIRLQRAGGLDASQLSDSQCRQIHQRTGGNPANINREATRLLMAASPAALPTLENKPNRWLIPGVSLAVVLLAAGLLTATYLVDDGENIGDDTSVAQETPAEEDEAATALPNRQSLEDKIRSSPSDEEGTPEGAAGETGPEDTAETPDTPSETTGAIAQQDAQPGTGSDGGAPAPDQTGDEQDAPSSTEQGERSGADSTPAQQASPEDGTPSAESNAPPEQAAAAEQTEPAEEQPEQTTDPTQQADQPEATSPPPSDHYTIQLIGAYDRESLEDFVQTLDLGERPRIVTTQRDGRDWHVVVYGNYASMDAAKSALRTLSQDARAHGAWIRTFGSI